MRQIFVVLILVSATFSLNASHIIGGSIHYEIISGNDYEVTLTLYRDCSSSTEYDDPASIGVFNSAGTLVYNLEIDFHDSIVSSVETESYNACFMAPLGLCVEEAIYVGTVSLPPIAGGYTLTYQRCCRNFSIVNVPTGTDVGITLTTDIPGTELTTINANPEFATHPPLVVCLNAPFVFDHSAFDVDGDQLVYEFCEPLNTNVSGSYINPPGAPPYNGLSYNAGYSSVYPIDASPAFTIDPATGLITGTPTSLGQYVFGVCIHEYRNGILINTTNRDFQLNVTTCDPVDSPVIADQEDVCSGLTVEFINGSIEDFTFHWDFGVAETETDTSNLFEPSYTYPAPGIYDIMLVMNPGLPCADTSYASYVSSPSLSPVISDFEYYCEDGSLLFNLYGDGGTDNTSIFEWIVANGGSTDTYNDEDILGIELGEAGTSADVTLTISEDGCSESVTNTINIPAAIQASIVPQNTFCDGYGYQFVNASQNATTYHWDFGVQDVVASSSLLDPYFTFPDTGLYVVELIAMGENICPDTTTTNMLIYGLLDPSYGQQPSQCYEGNTFSFEAVGASTDVAVYSWDFGPFSVPSSSSSQIPSGIHFTQPGTFEVALTITENDCVETYLDSVDVIVNPEFSVLSDTAIACGSANALFRGLTEYDFPVYYDWNFGDGTTVTADNPIHDFTTPGIYDITVHAYTESGCVDSEDFVFNDVIEIYTPPIAGFEIAGSSDELIGAYAEINSVAVGAVECYYSISDGAEYDTFNFTHEFTESGIITITQTVENEFGCTATAVGTVIINGYVFYAPNAFSPNSDDVNDVWKPEITGVTTYHLQIFNRWGDVIFETDDMNQPWTGEVHDGEYYAQDGVYIYQVVFEDLVGLPHDYRGHITLFR
ncbi:MAG: PKD domain-containing protein [Flavobacteriales bacterium]|nr:PKD domain-containing protein [Flavobacteriales bacterium]